MYGPSGVGALYVSKKIRKFDCAHSMGGPQVRWATGWDSNVPAIVGMGTACLLAQQELESESNMVAKLRDELSAACVANNSKCPINGHLHRRLCGNARLLVDHQTCSLLDHLDFVRASRIGLFSRQAVPQLCAFLNHWT